MKHQKFLNEERMDKLVDELMELIPGGEFPVEFIVNKDGETSTRQCGSFGPHEDEIVITVRIDMQWWGDLLANEGVEDVDNLNEIKDDNIRDYFEDCLREDVRKSYEQTLEEKEMENK